MIRSTFASTLTARVAALLGLGASLALAPAAEAQHTFADPGATFDPAVPTPRPFWDMSSAAASPRTGR